MGAVVSFCGVCNEIIAQAPHRASGWRHRERNDHAATPIRYRKPEPDVVLAPGEESERDFFPV